MVVHERCAASGSKLVDAVVRCNVILETDVNRSHRESESLASQMYLVPSRYRVRKTLPDLSTRSLLQPRTVIRLLSRLI